MKYYPIFPIIIFTVLTFFSGMAVWAGTKVAIDFAPIVYKPAKTTGSILSSYYYLSCGGGRFGCQKQNKVEISFYDYRGEKFTFKESIPYKENRAIGDPIEVRYFKDNPLFATAINEYLWLSLGVIFVLSGDALLIYLFNWAVNDSTSVFKFLKKKNKKKSASI